MSGLKGTYWILIFIAALLTSACSEPLAEANREFDLECWSMYDSISVSTAFPDLNSSYYVTMPLTLRDDYKYNNIILSLKIISPTGESLTFPYDRRLMSPEGAWFGEQKDLGIEMELVLSEPSSFSQSGEYTFVVYQYMQDMNLCGVSEAGLKIMQVD